MNFKITFCLLFYIFIFHFQINGQICAPSLNLTTQGKIDTFSTNYPNCDEIGNLYLRYNSQDPITNLNGLSQLTKITGLLSIEFTQVSSLTGLHNLEEIFNLSIIHLCFRL